MPDLEILKRYKQLGGEHICIGSDAHAIEYLGYRFDYAKECIQKAGFKYITYYKHRVKNFLKL
jgi:histidinol-phosphatase (PHP family)